MTTESKTKSFSGALLTIILFVIGCLFLYWAVEYWVYNNFDRARYEMSKIQPAGGGDSWAFWKLDRRTGAVEYCSMDVKAGENKPDFLCVRAKVVDNEDAPAFKSAEPAAAEPAPKAESAPVAETPAAAPAAPEVPVEAPAAAAQPAAPQQ